MGKKTVSKKKNFRLGMPRKPLLVGLVVLFAAVAAYFVFISNAAVNVTTNAPAAPAVYFSPTSQAIAINETFTVEVRENSGTTAVNAVRTNFTYPISLLEYVPTAAEVTTSNPNGVSFVGSAFETAAEASVNTASGAVTISRGTTGGLSLTGDRLIAKLTFRAKTTGGVAGLVFTTGTALVSATSNANILPSTGGLGNANYTIDTAAPSVSITSPATGSNVEFGSALTISASASDSASSVSKVEFYVNSVLVGTDTTSPYSFSWSTVGQAEGSRTVYARAYDAFNNAANSASITVNVKDTIAPSVSITSPTASSNLSGTVTVSATATDNSGGKGVSKVEFYVDGVLKGTDTTSPYAYSWDTKTATDAAHSLTARAYDASVTPNSRLSAAVSVTVDNSDKTPPSAPLNLRSTGNTYNSVSLAWDASTDNVGVAGYRLSRNGVQVYSGTNLSYTDTGLAEGASYSYSVVAFDAQGNVSAATTISATSKTRITGDLNSDDLVNVYDLSVLLSKWNTNDTLSDINKDGTVNVFDLSILLSNWTR
jgi:hypothetical protein